MSGIQITLPSSIPSVSAGGILTTAYVVIFWVLGAAAFIAVVYSGFMMITSNGDAVKFAQARKNLTWAIIGIMIIALSYFILVAVINFGGSFSKGTINDQNPIPNAQTK